MLKLTNKNQLEDITRPKGSHVL